ncbi:MAG: hypothetical protein IPM55_18850 [Acidobacteria bacterium]|nr:hypothetical protein [Acidobacteriota bacterium]
MRTKINSQYRRAEDKQLFAYEMVVPTDHIWYCSVDLSAIADNAVRATVLKQLQQLLKPGLRWLGKTKTRADVAIIKPDPGIPASIKSNASMQDDCWIVTLQSPAILYNPYEMNETSGAAQLEANYKAVWKQLSNNNLELSHYFAGQSLAGGFYTHRRFRSSNPADYYPFLLTNAGSVFVLKSAAGPDAQQYIDDWLKQGLPLPDWAKSKYARNGHEGDHWENCPYIRQNGYGEIAVNLDHQIKKLKEGEDCHAIESLVD